MAVESGGACVGCGRVAAPSDKRCKQCHGIAFVHGHPLTWWPLRFEDGEARFLFPKLDPPEARPDLNYSAERQTRSANRSRTPRAMRAL
jgi:hypothetical protein